jgi:ADP-ribose pyrophosphatase
MTSEHGRMTRDDLVDEYAKAPVTRSECVYEGRVWNVLSEEADLGDAGRVTRDFVDHPGAVAVLALRGQAGAEEVLVIQQYRHPIGAREWEIPAGLLDVDGEPPHEAALRELYEEADLRAGRLDLLIDYASSPGGLSEQLRIYLARDVSEVAADDRFEREDEELDMPTAWVSLDDVVAAAMAGRIHNPTLLMGAFAANVARANGWNDLRPADSPWEVHPKVS